jgi:hypothetical protein
VDFFFGFIGEENWEESINLLKHPWLTVSAFSLVNCYGGWGGGFVTKLKGTKLMELLNCLFYFDFCFGFVHLSASLSRKFGV